MGATSLVKVGVCADEIEDQPRTKTPMSPTTSGRTDMPPPRANYIAYFDSDASNSLNGFWMRCRNAASNSTPSPRSRSRLATAAPPDSSSSRLAASALTAYATCAFAPLNLLKDVDSTFSDGGLSIFSIRLVAQSRSSLSSTDAN